MHATPGDVTRPTSGGGFRTRGIDDERRARGDGMRPILRILEEAADTIEQRDVHGPDCDDCDDLVAEIRGAIAAMIDQPAAEPAREGDA